MQLTAKDNAQKLHPAADTEQRSPRGDHLYCQRQFQLIAVPIHLAQGRVRRLPELGRIDIDAPRQKQRVQIRRHRRGGRDGTRLATRGLNRVEVGLSNIAAPFPDGGGLRK